MKDDKKKSKEGAREDRRNDSEGKWGTRITIISVIALILAVGLYFFVQGYVKNPNRTAAKAAESAFRSTYGMKYEEFVKSTIYNDKCQKHLHMEIFDELEEIEALFQSMQGEETAYQMTIKNTKITEYGAKDEMFSKLVSLLKVKNVEADTAKIDRAATAEIQYRLTYTDDGESEEGTETYYVFRVDGKWYCHPMLSVMDE